MTLQFFPEKVYNEEDNSFRILIVWILLPKTDWSF